MTRKITFLHTADLHIGAPMRGFCNLTDAWAARLRRAEDWQAPTSWATQVAQPFLDEQGDAIRM